MLRYSRVRLLTVFTSPCASPSPTGSSPNPSPSPRGMSPSPSPQKVDSSPDSDSSLPNSDKIPSQPLLHPKKSKSKNPPKKIIKKKTYQDHKCDRCVSRALYALGQLCRTSSNLVTLLIDYLCCKFLNALVVEWIDLWWATFFGLGAKINSQIIARAN